MAYTKEQIHDIVLEQRKYFRTGETLDINWRKQQLRKLKEVFPVACTMLGLSSTFEVRTFVRILLV